MEVPVHFKGGGSFVNYPPIFSNDGESVFVCSKNVVEEYSAKTGKLLHTYKGIQDKIIGFECCTFNSYCCIAACSVNGEIAIWQTASHFKVFQKLLFQQIPLEKLKTFHILPSEEKLRALVSYKSKSRICFEVITLSANKKHTVFSIEHSKSDYHVSVGNGYFSVAWRNNLDFIKLGKSKQVSRVLIDDSLTFTCITTHPTEEIVLTGDSLGRVRSWKNIFEKNKVQTIFHWHTLPVRTVCFSTSGSYFYSGADECVLVKWQSENASDRRFVPRIAAEINHIAVSNNNLYVAVSTRDNAIRILDSTLNQITVIQQLVLGKHYDCGLTYDHRTKALITNGNHGQVQFYSTEHMSLLYNVDIVVQNKITNERNCTMINTEITKMAISKCGLWLATVEERNDDLYSNEIRLKFWKFDLTHQKFELNTSIEYPHEKSINSLAFQPVLKNNVICVTVGNDNKFKVWKLSDASTVYKKDVMWLCLGIGFHRDLPCKALSFSADGSLLATGFGKLLTIWTPDTCELKCSLTHPLHIESINHVCFGSGLNCHLVVAASTNQVSAWNVLTLTMMWTVCLPVSLLIADGLCDYMAAVTRNNKVYVFSPASPELIYASQDLLKKYDNIVAATFVPSKFSSDVRLEWYQRTPIFFITSSNELFCLGATECMDEIPEYEDSSEGFFRKMQPLSKVNLAKTSGVDKFMFEKDMGHKSIKKYLEAPIHTSAPVRFLCYSMIRSLSLQSN
nr:unnamed protein product [Callosobruchus chinensis]